VALVYRLKRAFEIASEAMGVEQRRRKPIDGELGFDSR
jgi:hypothetical protein